MTDAINWIVQGLVLGLVAAGCSRIWRRAPAAARYALWWTTLLAILAVPLLPAWTPAGPGEAMGGALPPLVAVPEPGAPAATLFFAVWALCSAAALARLGAAAWIIRRIRRTCTALPAARASELTLWNRVSTTGRRARLVVSPHVDSAAVLGGRTPVIAVSPALLHQLSADELDQIVVHEWSHVQRRDDLMQAVQQVARAVLVLHPAVWWITRQIQLERELACDEQVAALVGSPRHYAASLVKLAGIVRVPRTAAAFPSALDQSQLATRVLRLVEHSRGRAPRLSMAAMAAGVLLLTGALAASLSVDLVGGLAPRIASSAAAGVPDEYRSPRVALPGPPVPALPHTPRTFKPAGGSGPSPGVLRKNPSGPSSTSDAPVAELQQDTPPAVVSLPVDASLTLMPGMSVPMPDLPSATSDDSPSIRPWSAATGAGIALGRGSTKAARATAGFFTRMGKSIGGRF